MCSLFFFLHQQQHRGLPESSHNALPSRSALSATPPTAVHKNSQRIAATAATLTLLIVVCGCLCIELCYFCLSVCVSIPVPPSVCGCLLFSCPVFSCLVLSLLLRGYHSYSCALCIWHALHPMLQILTLIYSAVARDTRTLHSLTFIFVCGCRLFIFGAHTYVHLYIFMFTYIFYVWLFSS